MSTVFIKNSAEPIYMQLYLHFSSQIINGVLTSGTKLPSIRRCGIEFGVSKTTVESAYMQLCAEGYITAVPQSGYYVSEISDFARNNTLNSSASAAIHKNKQLKFDFTSSSVDEECFDFKLWQRYVKSALRTGTRLLSYGDPQGEPDLRAAIKEYVSKSRGVSCNEDQIVVGAGVQCLLQLLCAIDKERETVVFTGTPYIQGETVFSDYGYTVIDSQAELLNSIPDSQQISMVYTSPSNADEWGNVMSISNRVNLLRFAQERECLIIEDDYDSEFRYYSHPVPSLQNIDGGENVIYIGTFSKLLLPSLRVSFMVLPISLINKYNRIKYCYNQTASKTEQIALCRYLVDGHLMSQIRRTRRRYVSKTKILYNELKKYSSKFKTIYTVPSGLEIVCEFKTDNTVDEFGKILKSEGIDVNVLGIDNNNVIKILLSAASIKEKDIETAVRAIIKIVV